MSADARPDAASSAASSAGSFPASPVRPIDAGAAATMVVLCATWGLGQIAIKVGMTGISPMWQAGLRSVGAAALLIGWMLWRRIALLPSPGMTGWGILIGLAFGLEFVCLFIGMSLTTAARGTVLLYTAPFFVAIGSHVLLGDRLTAPRIGGLALAFAGVAVALGGRAAGGAQGDWRGDLLCVAAGLLWALTTLIIKATPLRAERAERTLLDQLAVSAVLLLGASALFGEPGVFAPSPMVWASLAFQTVVIASISYLAWFVLVQRHSPASLSAFTFLTPLFGVGFAVLLLGEVPTLSLLAAATLIAGGIWLVNRR